MFPELLYYIFSLHLIHRAPEIPCCNVQRFLVNLLICSPHSRLSNRSLQVVLAASRYQFLNIKLLLWYASPEGNIKSGFLFPSVTAAEYWNSISIKYRSKMMFTTFPALPSSVQDHFATFTNSSTSENPLVIMSPYLALLQSTNSVYPY